MGLIEKAGGPIEGAFGPAPSETDEGSAKHAQLFDIDFAGLAKHGFYTPADRTSRLSLELRAIKRTLLRRMGFRNSAGDPRVARKAGRQRNLVLFTSTQPGEGKTFCAINLALSLACEEEIDVLLIDADTPRPKVRAFFGLPESKGLTDRLMDPSMSVAGLTMRARQAPLSILSEGTSVPRASELFASPEGQRLFTELSMRRTGRIILIDAPPVLATTEAIMLARHVDEIVFVVEADATPEGPVGAALDELLDANQNISLLLNRCLIGASGAYYGAYGDYDRKNEVDPPSAAAARPEQ